MQLRISEFLFLGLPLLCSALFVEEIRALWHSDPGDGAEISLGLPISYPAARTSMIACVNALAPPRSLLATQIELNDHMAVCAQRFETALDRMPTSGLAHLGLAFVAATQGDRANAQRRLNLSRQFSPHEGWLAERRFILATELFPDQVGPPEFRADIATLLTSQSGAELVSAFYRLHQGLRPVISAAAGTAKASDQQRFLNLLRRQGAAS